MTGAQRLAVGVLALAGGLAVVGELSHRDGVDATEAILRVRTHRFGGSTRARLSTWLNQTGQQDQVRWAATRDGLFSRGLTVTLTRPDAEPARFHWAGQGVTPLNPAAEAAIAAVKAHAERPAVAAPARTAPAAPARLSAEDTVPPVRPFVPDPASD